MLREEWLMTVRAYQKNAMSKRDSMILEHAALVKYIAERLAMRLPSNVEKDDLVEVGIIGLIDAIDKYIPEKGVKFKSYAEIRIRGAMLDYLRALDWMPRSVRDKAREIARTFQVVENRLKRNASDEEMAEEMGISLYDYHQLLNESRVVSLVSIDEVLRNEKGGRQRDLNDVIIDINQKSCDDIIDTHQLRKILKKAITALPEKEKLVISLYYYDELTMKEIGLVLELTESRVSQLHSQAVLRLKSKLKDTDIS
jgi:RNA polymerase sigma factor for flagellar operon FliA